MVDTPLDTQVNNMLADNEEPSVISETEIPDAPEIETAELDAPEVEVAAEPDTSIVLPKRRPHATEVIRQRLLPEGHPEKDLGRIELRQHRRDLLEGPAKIFDNSREIRNFQEMLEKRKRESPVAARVHALGKYAEKEWGIPQPKGGLLPPFVSQDADTGDYVWDHTKIAKEKQDIVNDITSWYTKNVKGTPEEDKEFLDQVASIGKDFGIFGLRAMAVLQESFVNVASKDLPWIVKNVLLKAPAAAVLDVPHEDLIGNMWSWAKNKGIDGLKFVFGVNYRNYYAHSYDWKLREFEVDGKVASAYEHIEEFDKKLGISKKVEEIGSALIIERVPEKDRNIIHHMIRFGVEIVAPLTVIPVFMSMRLVAKGKRYLDNYAIETAIGKHARVLREGGDMSEDMIQAQTDMIRKALDDERSIVDGSIDLQGGFTHKVRPYNKKRAAQEIGLLRSMSITLGAGSAGGAVYELTTESDNMKEFSGIAYLAALVGAIKGGTGILRMTGKTPGVGTAIFQPESLAMQAVTAFPIRATYNRLHWGILKVAGDWMYAWKGMGEGAVWMDSKMGKWMQSQSAGVPIGRSVVDMIRTGGKNIDRMIQEQRFPSRSFKHLQEMFKRMPFEEQERIKRSVRAAVNLAKKLDETVGAEGVDKHFFFIDQVTNLAVLRSQRQMLMQTVKFGDEGFLSKYSGWSWLSGIKRRVSLETHLEKYEREVEKQVVGIASMLKSFRKTQALGTQGKAERVRMANFLEDYLARTLEESRLLKDKLLDFKKESGLMTGGYERDQFLFHVLKSQDTGGLVLPKYMKSVDDDASKPLSKEGQAVHDEFKLEEMQTDSKVIVEQARDAAFRTSNAFYARFLEDTRWKGKVIPINNVVETFTNDIIKNNPVLHRWMGKQPGEAASKLDFIRVTKEKFLNQVDSNGNKMVQKQHLDTMLEEIRKTKSNLGDDFKIFHDGTEIGHLDIVQKQEELLKNIAELSPAQQRDALADFLARLSGDKASSTLLGHWVPSVIDLTDLKMIKTHLASKAKKSSRISQTDSKVYYKAEEVQKIMEAYDLDALDDPVAKVILEAQGLSKADIAEYIKLKKTADTNYKKTVVDPWKTSLGDTLTKEVTSTMNPWADEENLLWMFLPIAKALDKSQDAFPLAMKHFNEMFPKKGTRDIYVRDADGNILKGVDEKPLTQQIDNADLRKRAKEMLLQQLIYKIKRGGDPGMEFARALNYERINLYVKAGIIEAPIAKNLKSALKQLQTKNVGWQELKLAQDRLGRHINDLTKLSTDAVEKSWASSVMRGDDFDAMQFAESLITGAGGRNVAVTKAAGRSLKSSIEEDISSVSSKLENETGQAVSGTTELQKGVGVVELVEKARAENIEVFINAAKSGKNPEQAIQMIDDAHDVLLNYAYNTSFHVTRRRSLFKPSTYKGKRGKKFDTEKSFSDAEKLYGRERLRMDVDPEILSKTLDDSKDSFRKLAEARLTIARQSGKADVVKAAVDDLDMLDQLDDVVEAAVIARGEVGQVTILHQPVTFAASQIISRLYALGRNVVGPQYLATEAAYKAWHVAHASMLNDVLFNPNSVKILHKIMVRQGRMSRADFRDLGAIVIKAFGRGQGFATEKERKEGDQMLAFRSKMEITDKMLQKATGILLGILPTEVPRPVFPEGGLKFFSAPRPPQLRTGQSLRPSPPPRPSHYPVD